MPSHHARVYPLPDWLDAARLLGPGDWQLRDLPGVRLREAQASLDEHAASDLVSRLRGIGVGGHALAVEIDPPLARRALRAGRERDARRRRETTPASARVDLSLDDQARMSWTPEALALRMAAPAAGLAVIDACCGAGGNTIAFARAGCSVVAIERDADRVRFVVGDAVELVGGQTADLLFVDPPWGRDWNRRCTRADALDPLLDLLARADAFAHVWCKLPPSIDPGSLPGRWTFEALFGEAAGDRRRIKLIWARRA
jgi:hypothetical protein